MSSSNLFVIPRHPLPAKHLNRTLSKRELFLIPLTIEEHGALSNPPQLSFIRLKEERAKYDDLWTVWFRVRATLAVVQRHHTQVLDEVQPIVERIEAFFLEPRDRDAPVTMPPDLLDELRMVLDLADEVQKETNRAHLLEAFKAELEYCRTKAKETHGQEQQKNPAHAPVPGPAQP